MTNLRELAALPDGCLHDDCLHCAWGAVEKILPEGWEMCLEYQQPPHYWAIAREQGGVVSRSRCGPTPAAALRALEAELRKQG